MQNFCARVLLLCLSVLVSSLCASAADRTSCYTMWDDDFLYVAFEVPDTDIVSANTTHMSSPWEDDCVEVYLETDNAKASERSGNTYQMSVSAGGGSSFMVGENGRPAPKTIFTFKYARRVRGTINRPRDRDTGYVVELAMPWKEMGGPPEPGAIMGFNLITRFQGENTGFSSLSPNVVTEEDVHVPAKWGSIKFVDTPTVIAWQDGVLVCRKVLRNPPFINGVIAPNEWIADLRVSMTKPDPTEEPRQPEFALEKLALTHYFYWYQGDPRKDAPFGHVRYEDGSSALTTHPLDGTGPWFSHDRVQWHKDQLLQIRDAGIDVVIPVYWGSAVDKRHFSSKGLSCMVQAMKELRAEGKTFPLVGMFFDTSAMGKQYGEKPNLKDDEVKRTFYGMIKDFFLHIPENFRASVQMSPQKGGDRAAIVVLYTASHFSDLDAAFVDFCNQQFAKDFGGRLIWIGRSDFRPKAEVFDGYSNYGAGLGLKYDDAGWIRIAGVGAGYDDSAVRGRTTPIRSRMGGDTYKNDWDELVEKKVDWLIVDGWNELHEGSEICATAEYGDRYVGLTKINMLRFNGMEQYDAKFLRHDTPRVMTPGSLYQVNLTIRNAGTKPWYPGSNGVFILGRWFKDGRPVVDSGLTLPLQRAVLAGDMLHRMIAIRTVDSEGNPLPEGEYELRWELRRGPDQLFSDTSDVPLCVPVTIGDPKPGMTFVSSTLPTHLKSGAAYAATVRVRNDGPVPWKAGSTVVRGAWYRVSADIGADSTDEAVPVDAAVAEVALAEDVAPGMTAEAVLRVPVTMSDGTPSDRSDLLPIWTQNHLWTYLVKWDVLVDGVSIGSQSIGVSSEVVKVVADDYGPVFVSSDTPAEMQAGKTQKVNLTLRNGGPEVWKKADLEVGYHWYYLDGIEAVWDGDRTRLPSDVRPGQEVIVKASVTPPPCDGQYYLVWDLVHGDKWASTTANTRGGDILVTRVRVVGGRLMPQDLSLLFDKDVVTFDHDRTDGDADGSGHTFPGEYIPPLATTLPVGDGLWPSGLWSAASGSGLESSRRISFRYPSKADGQNNAVQCGGQEVSVTPGRYLAAHVMAFATEDVSGEFGITYRQGSSTAPVRFTKWDKSPANGESPAFVGLHRHSSDGDERGQACWLNHYVLQLDPAQELTSIKLPRNPAVKVMAITLERAP